MESESALLGCLVFIYVLFIAVTLLSLRYVTERSPDIIIILMSPRAYFPVPL
jgi:hypothetical protein